jgi:transcriptional regulator with GAF, ATPase, and Fis domain
MGELIQAIASPSQHRKNGRRMVGKSAAFLAVMDQLHMVAAAQAPVLLQGETGTGKELAASFIHHNSPRAEQPFLTVDCTVLTEPLFEAEVFGHARGAFTGSVGERTGLYEQADGGSLFLDEVGELPLSQQAKLLRVLESGQYRRVGGKSCRNANVRIICATNRHLWDEVKTGQFREDLYYRIACLAVRMPPLRERLEDIQLLVPELLEPVSNTMSRDFSITADALDRLMQYDYPGNVRELRNILFIAATHSSNGEIDESTVDEVLKIQARSRSRAQPCPEPIETGSVKSDAAATPPQQDTSASMEEIEAQHITRLLEQLSNNRRKVAEALGISERTLYRKIKKYALGK